MSRFPREGYRALTRYVPDRRPVDVDLTDNTNLWGPHPAAVAAVREAGEDVFTRYPDPYVNPIKAVLARTYGVSAANLCTGCGSDDILDAAFRAASADGGLVRYPAPTFSMIPPFTRMNGHEEGPVPWSTALSDPRTLLDGAPVVVYVCRPNNPTGHSVPRTWLDELFAACSAMGSDAPLLLIDEAYAEFAGESLVADAPGLPRTLVLRTLSKAFGLAGLRVGWAVGPTEVVDEVEKARGPYKVGRLAETAAIAALQDPEGWVPEVIARCLENRSRLFDALRERGLAPFPSAANFLFIPLEEGTARATALALRERGVAVRPFGDDTEIGDGLRVTVGPWPLMERFLSAVDQVKNDDPGPWSVPEVESRQKAVGVA